MISPKKVAALISLAALAGCNQTTTDSSSSDKIKADMAGMSPCQKVSYVLSQPYASQRTVAVAMEVGRNNGCFGQAPPQRVIIQQNVTVKQQ